MKQGFRLAALAALVALPLHAQEAADTAALPDLVITATPVPVRPDALTAAVTVLSGRDLRERGIHFVHDALREVPGLTVVQQGSWGSVTSLFARGGESDYVKVLIDGVPANQPGGGFDFAALTTQNVDRIEIVRGPASVMHGSDAVTGVVHIITRSGASRISGWGSAGGGSHGSHAIEGSVAGGSPSVGWSFGASRFGTRGTYAFNNDFGNTAASAKVTARRARTKLAASVGAAWHRSEFPTDGVGAPVDSNQFTSGHSITTGAAVSHELHSRLSTTVAATVTDLRLRFSDRSDSPGDTTGFAFASDRAVDVTRLGARVGLDFRPAAGGTISAGAQLDRDAERQEGAATSDFGAGSFTDIQPPFDRTRWNRALFLQGTADLRRRLGATIGIRLDDNDAFGDFLTARAGVSYTFPSATRVRASLGSAFKAPTFAENFAATPFEVGNPALEPERTRSWEVGVEQTFARGALTISAGWFDQRFRNLIQYVAAAPGEPTYENLGAAEARGLEAGVRIDAGAGASITTQYTYLETEVTGEGVGGSPSFIEGERLLRRPTHAARGGIALRRGPVAASAAVQVTGKRDDVDFGTFERITLPAHATLDLTAAVDVLPRTSGPALALIFRVENALDEEYLSVAGFPGRPRTLFAGARIER